MAPASAQVPSIQSLTVPIEVEHDSNPLMSVGGSPGTTFVRVAPVFTHAFVRDQDRVELEAGVTAEKSSNTDVSRDRVDPRLRASWKHQDPINTVELAALAERSALRSLDVREQVPVGVDGSRTLAAVTGKWKRDLDPLTSVTADARQEWVRYSRTTTPDYRRSSGAVRLTRERTEVQSWFVALDGQAIHPDAVPGSLPGSSRRSGVVGALAGVSQAFSEYWRGEVAAGPVRFTGDAGRSDWQGSAKADYTAERWDAGAELARTPSVNSTLGRLVVTQELRLRARYELDSLSRIELLAAHAREKALGNDRSVASGAWTRQLSPVWQLAVKAAAHRQRGPAGMARSNRIGVVLTYTGLDL